MSYQLIIRPEAEADLEEAFSWYERRRRGLGTSFLQRVEESFARLIQTPEMHAVIFKNVRRSLVRRFPYIVYYRVDESQVTILAVLHGRRDPSTWQTRI